MKEIIINIEGMKCIHCVKHVENALKEIKKIKRCKVSLENKNAIIIGDDDLELNVVKEAIIEAGYEPII